MNKNISVTKIPLELQTVQYVPPKKVTHQSTRVTSNDGFTESELLKLSLKETEQSNIPRLFLLNVLYSTFRKYSDPFTFFTFFVTALCWNCANIFSFINLHSIHHDAKAKNRFFLQMYWKGKAEILHGHKYSDPLLWYLKFSSGASHFSWSSLRCFLHHDWSPPVVNSIDWTWFGKSQTCLY